MTRAFWNGILADHAAANLIAAKLAAPDPYDAWLDERRDEAKRLHRAEYQAWIKAGCVPAVKYGVVK